MAGSDEEITELVSTLFPTDTISQAFDSATLKADLERIKQVLREHLHVDL